jgi:hypothetical protein
MDNPREFRIVHFCCPAFVRTIAVNQAARKKTIKKRGRHHLPAGMTFSRLGVFGSYARGEATEHSEIDVAVDFNGPMGLQNDRSNPVISLPSKGTYTANLSFDEFSNNLMVTEACLYNIRPCTR